MKFSKILSKTEWENGVLKLSLRKTAALAFILSFLFALVALLITKEFPILIVCSILIGILILFWALWDVLRSQLIFEYDVEKDYLKVKAWQRKRFYRYHGQSLGRLNLKKVKNINANSNRDTYSIILEYRDKKVRIPLMIEPISYSEQKAIQKLDMWSERLGLG